MKTILNKLGKFLDFMFYVVVCWHIAVSHQPEPEHHKYAIIELYEHGLYASTEEYTCDEFILKEKGGFLGFHSKATGAFSPETGKYVGEDEIKCRYILKHPTDWGQKVIHP